MDTQMLDVDVLLQDVLTEGFAAAGGGTGDDVVAALAQYVACMSHVAENVHAMLL